MLTWRAVVAVALAAGFLAGGATGARVVAGVGPHPHRREPSQVALPATHFLMMGAQSESFWGAPTTATTSRSRGPSRRGTSGS